MWRSLIPAERLEGLKLEERGNYWFGPGRTLITYWVRPKKLYSVLASVPAHEVQRESWTESGDISQMLRSFDDAEPRARAMLEQCKTAFITGMYYRDPIDSWTSGRVTLLGDAAHPMVPFLAAGAGQSIEDAWVFARVLARRQHDVPGALLEYERRRLPRTTRIQAGARAVVKLMHESDGGRVRDRNGRWKGLARIDPFAETSWGLAWDYNVVKAVEAAPGEVLNVTGLREGKALQRPEGQRAFDLWKHAFRPEDVARGHDGLREAFPDHELSAARANRGNRRRTRRRQGVSRRRARRAARQFRAAFPRRRLSHRVGQGLARIRQPAGGCRQRHLLHRRLSPRARASLSGGNRRRDLCLSCAAGARHPGKLDPGVR
jgi:salicylate hydroxylase